ncbi:DUF2062 domain-containing protein [Leptothoe spongobia]|uniref:DUF2062 domain-containing protein n=1 Tax=Leptothoe spongobia TAU-MAC 1115 TaxID=1967444 RepID=A0A947DG78_9CYAN|nr:DUF2062 domain-containing protein [Leptothoe spongobia]MBT9316170.1 DUF2062 domain-containing protein [Leptothoe spongobia TAU-MAC 1115]
MADPNSPSDDQRTNALRAHKRSFHSRRNILSKMRRLVRYVYIRFIRLRSHPRAIARGVAAGTFAGSYPLFGLQTLLGVAIAAAVRGNKIVAAAGTWISNPLTYVPIYAFNYQVGRWILGQSNEANLTGRSPQEWMNLGLDITVALMVGSTLVGLVLAIISYYIALNLAYNLRSNRNNR